MWKTISGADDPFIDDLAMKRGDFPWPCETTRSYVPGRQMSGAHGMQMTAFFNADTDLGRGP